MAPPHYHGRHNPRRWHNIKRWAGTASAGALGYINNNLPGAWSYANSFYKYYGPYNEHKHSPRKHVITNTYKAIVNKPKDGETGSNPPGGKWPIKWVKGKKTLRIPFSRSHRTHKRAKKYIKKRPPRAVFVVICKGRAKFGEIARPFV